MRGKRFFQKWICLICGLMTLAGCGGKTAAAPNEAPDVFPAAQEWQGGYGAAELGAFNRILYNEEDEDVGAVASMLQADVQRLTGWEMTFGAPSSAKGGDIMLALTDDRHLGEEGYRLEIGDTVRLTATTPRGLYWATRSLLQIAKAELAKRETDAASAIALPRGNLRDFPDYETRGFSIDVARNFVSMETLYELVDALSWHKMNELIVHLNDNEMIVWSGKKTHEEAFTAYAAFRMESEIAGENGVPLTATDGSYSREAFRALVDYAAARGVTVIPEIDTPAHALSITRMAPRLALTGAPESAAMLDIAQAEARELAFMIWREQIEGEDAAFANCPVVHIGGDEYYGSGDAYVAYENELIAYLQAQGKTVRMWSCVGGMKTEQTLNADGVQMCVWDTTVWADAEELHAQGCDLINLRSDLLYLIPGSGYDYLDTTALYENFFVNRFPVVGGEGDVEFDADDPQIKGACFALWNDYTGALDAGITERDMLDRVYDALPVLSYKMWNAEGGFSYENIYSINDTLGRVF